MKKKKLSIKKITNRVFNAFKKFVDNIIDYFKKASKKLTWIIIVWIGIVLLLIILVVVCNFNNKFLNKFYLVEEQMDVAAVDYAVTRELYPSYNKPLKVTLDELITSNFYDTAVSVPDTCTGYSVLFYNGDKDTENELDKYRVESYINCKEYTTDNYNDYANN